MDILFLIGRILYGGTLLIMSLNHFTKSKDLAAYAGGKGVPAPGLAVFVSGASLFLGSLGILLGAYIQLSVLLLAIFFVPVTLMMHNFWKDQDPMMKMSNMTNFMKNSVILGAALMMLLMPTPWPYALNL